MLDMRVVKRTLGGRMQKRVFPCLVSTIWRCWGSIPKQCGHISLRQQCRKSLWLKNLSDVCHRAEAVEHDPILPTVRVQEHCSAGEKQSQWKKTTYNTAHAMITSHKIYLVDAHNLPSSWLYCWSKHSSTCWHKDLSFLLCFITCYKCTGVKMLSKRKGMEWCHFIKLNIFVSITEASAHSLQRLIHWKKTSWT